MSRFAARLGLVAGFALAGAAAHATSVVVTWNQAALAEVRAGRLGPPIVARALAVAHTCMYDAWTAYDPVAVGAVVATQRRPSVEHTAANKHKAVSYAAYRCLANLFPAGAARLQAVMVGLGYDPADVSTRPNTPQGIGNAAAAAVIASRRDDGANQYGTLAPGAYADYTGFVPSNPPMPFCLPTTPGDCPLNVTDPYHWQPLINDRGVGQTYIAPHWERVRPFALTSATQFDDHKEVAPGPNYLQSKKKLYADLDEIVGYSADLDPARKLIVEYWADGPESELPPGHWSLFAQFVSARDRHGIDQDVKLFFAMQNASFDAGILAWHQKRKHVGVRPITAIRYFYDGRRIKAWGGPGQPVQLIDGGKWTPYNPGSNLTPAFPGYVSGHSTFSAASATVLRAFTGSDHFGFETTIPPNFGRVEPGVPAVPTVLRYSTFTAAVTDAGLSRLYGGIHFADDNTVGQVLGNLAGQEAWAKAQFLFAGGLAVAGSSSTTSADTKKLSWNHVVGPQNDRLLVVGIATTSRDSYAKEVSYDGRDLSFLGLATTSAEDNQVELWYLKSPASGTGKVSVRMSNKNDVVAGAVNFVGVDQQTPFGIVRTRGSDTAAACVTLANEPAPLVLSALAANADALAVSPGSGQTVLWNAVSRADTNWTAYDNIGTAMVGPGAPIGDVCQVLQRGRRWSLIAVPLKPAR